MTLRGKRLLLIGGGNMGAALASGLISAGTMSAKQICVTDVRSEVLGSLKKRLGINTATSNAEPARISDVILLCVKPQQMSSVLAEIGGSVRPRQLVISIAAGITTQFIQSRLGRGVPVIRVMPNTPALLRAGAIVFSLGRSARAAHEKLAQEILGSVGKVWKVASESLMDAVTALSGSGPAYVFHLAECLQQAGRKLNLPPALAEALARQTIYGSGLMLSKSSEPAALLRERVTSPGGTTAAALKVLGKAGVQKIFEKALKAARDRSKELSGG